MTGGVHTTTDGQPACQATKTELLKILCFFHEPLFHQPDVRRLGPGRDAGRDGWNSATNCIHSY